MLRRFLLAAVTAVTAFAGFTATTAEAATTYRVVGTGDSILAMAGYVDILAPGGALLTDDTWVNVEYGRQPYVAGMSGQASTASIWPLVLSRSQPGGWIIIQDNGLGTTNVAWRALMQRIVDETPNDRCLLFVPPVFHWWFNATQHNTTTVYANILTEVTDTARAGGQCVRILAWRTVVLEPVNGRSYVCDSDVPPVRGFAMPADVENHQPSRCDGQHPSLRGQIWLTRNIEAIIGS